MAAQRNIASSAPGTKASPQPGFVPDAAALPPDAEETELSSPVGMALAAFGVGGDGLKVEKPVEKPKPKPKEGAQAEGEGAETGSEGEGSGEGEGAEADGEGQDTGAEGEGAETGSESEGSGEGEGAEADGEGGETRDKRRERFEKLTAKLHEKDELIQGHEARIAELEEQLENASTARAAPTRESPLADVTTEAELTQRVTLAKQTQRWCLRNPEGGKPPGGERELSAEDVENWLTWADGVLDAQEGHRAVLTKREENRAEAAQRYPTQFQNGHADARLRSKLLKEIPGLNAHPERDLIIGRLARAMAEETQEKGGKGRYVFMPLNPAEGGKPEAKGKEGAGKVVSAAANGARPAPRTPVQHPNQDPKRKQWEAVASGQPVSAESLLLG